MTKLGLLTLAALFMSAASAFAAPGDTTVGANELHFLETIFTGYIGLTVGFAIALIGIFRIVNQDMKGGLILIALGVLISLLPGLFNGVNMVICPIAEQLTAGATNKVSC